MFPNTVFFTETMFANIILLWKIMTYCRLWSGWIGLSGAFRAISIPENTNLMQALSPEINAGCRRETYFLNQLRAAGHEVKYPAVGDFLVDEAYLFEVGGKGKTFEQIKDLPNSFIAYDDVEVGRGNKIPLWLFGFLY